MQCRYVRAFDRLNKDVNSVFIFSSTSILNSIPEYIKTAFSVKHFKSLYLRWYKQSFES